MKPTFSYPKIRLTKSVRPFFKADFDQCNKTKSITDTESMKVQIGMFKKGIQYSLGFWIPRRGFQIPGTGYQSLSVELWTLDFNGYSDSWFLELYFVFQSQDFWFHKQEFPTFWNPDFLTRGDLDDSRLLLQAIVFIYRSNLHSFLFKHKYFDPQAGMRVVRNWIKPNKSGFHVMPEWVFYNSVSVLVSWEQLQTKENNINEKKIEHIKRTFSKLFDIRMVVHLSRVFSRFIVPHSSISRF